MSGAKLVASSAVVFLWAVSSNAASITPDEAASHVGKTATVCGVVASTKYDGHLRSQPTFLDFGKPYPNESLHRCHLRPRPGEIRHARGDVSRQARLRHRPGSQLSRKAGDHCQRSEPVERIGLISGPAPDYTVPAGDAFLSAGAARRDRRVLAGLTSATGLLTAAADFDAGRPLRFGTGPGFVSASTRTGATPSFLPRHLYRSFTSEPEFPGHCRSPF